MQNKNTITQLQIINQMKRRIKHVTVLGSGIMGSGIAAHFANIGVQVSLLDIVPFELPEVLEEINVPGFLNCSIFS